jgi:tagatose-1,6-bisphosphate aldolase non-catalytic subunit AgaZ/GatZ
MITETQIIEAAKECGLYGFRSPTPEVIEAATKFAQHFYRQGLLDAAEKIEKDEAEAYFNLNANDCAEAIRQMAEKIK